MSQVPFSNVYVDIVRPTYNVITGATGGANRSTIATGLRCRLSAVTKNDWLVIPPDMSARADVARRKLYKLRVPSGQDITEGDVIQNVVMLNRLQYWPSLQLVADGSPVNVTAKVRFVMESDAGPLGVRTAFVDVNITGGPTSPLQ